ncbi:MAG: hypothetical protein J7577_12510 [Sphingobacteriaceae bacterium]|nr:hypothetical protein [Sphingobacteriaceae bacterium]
MESFIKLGNIDTLRPRMSKSPDLVPCIVQDSFVELCRHKGCKFLHKFPINYFERRSEKIKQRKDSTYFFVSKSKWLLPINPYRKKAPERNRFELFRQGWGEIRIVGQLPPNRDTFHRDEISFKFITFLKQRIEQEKELTALEMTDYEDIEEVAYYNRPI